MTPALRQTLRDVIALGEEAIGPVLMRRLEDEMSALDIAQTLCVPVEPTQEMSVAGRKALCVVADRMKTAKLLATSSIDFWQKVGHTPANEVYKAMLAAVPLSTSPAAPVAGDGRTPQDFAIEFGEYLAVAADRYAGAVMTYDSAAEDQDRDQFQAEKTEAWSALRLAIYEFRKRKDRAQALGRTTP